ncbi:HEAT repeat domain-containing protein [Providencia vermicola]|uniref:HEAT repeat domain-containing protein n=2 Tax=Providencia TaxID=586 RepID=A0AAI9HXC4_PROST|nr:MULTISPECIES: HEAT repeat domain-containing protein [Providencia]ELR5034595.1 HEAT repeat domain-containing protein [Providencia stuartii]ELR5121047.1 HEAT repeat domain-containing protein [Providencia stuartii]ELX8377665.1 HEAT repeat domain-containing protein [Providencia stuartii]ELZ5938624.1 HEAT repeat domain-containing protein [Providencia stuartii]EMD5257206.1 HEAT repeat domain-containing protein [Providencia stuartii]
MEKQIIGTLIELTFRGNDDVKIAAISALGDYKATIEQQDAVIRLIELCKDPNKEVAVSSIRSLSKLSEHFSRLVTYND